MSGFKEDQSNLQLALRKVEQDIEECEQEIVRAAANVLSENGDMRKYWITKEESLRRDKESLRRKEESLRQDKDSLVKERLIFLEALAATGKHQAIVDSILGGVGDLSISDGAVDAPTVTTLRETPLCQKSASSFCTSRAEGLGYLPTFTRFIPSTFSHIKDLLMPNEEDIKNAPMLRIYGEESGLMTVKETETGGINAQFSRNLQNYFSSGLEANGQKRLRTRHLDVGIADGSSYEDYHGTANGAATSIMELKGADGSIIEAVSQAVVTSSNMQIGLLNKGVPIEECILPVIASTGLVMTFGVSLVLSPSFPTYIPISKQLDLSDPFERRVAAAYLEKAIQQSKSIGSKIPPVPPANQTTKMLLDLSAYHSKMLDESVFERGLGMFDNTGDVLRVQPGMIHMVEALNKLYADEGARDYAEYPLSIRTPDKCIAKNGCRFYELFYRDLTSLGFKIGAPNRMEEPEIFEVYRDEVQKAVDAVHRAGVLHGDLYLSNIMFKVEEGGRVVTIKIIDWDAAHCLEEGKFAPEVEKKLVNYLGRENVEFAAAHDLRYVSVLSQEVTEDDKEDWVALASGEKGAIDTAFRRLFKKQLV